MLTRPEYEAAVLTAPPVPLTAAYIRERVAARSESTLDERIASAAYLDVIVCQERGELTEDEVDAREVMWARVTGNIRDEAVIAHELLAGLSSGD